MKKKRAFTVFVACMAILLFLSGCKQKPTPSSFELSLQSDAGWFVKEFASNPNDSLLNRAVEITDSLVQQSDKNYFDVFLEVWEGHYREYVLIEHIDTYHAGFNEAETNNDVIEIMKIEYNAAIDTAMRIIKSRLTNAGAQHITIEKTTQLGVITVKTDSVMPPERFEKVLTAVGNLEFYETFDVEDIFQNMSAVDKFLTDNPKYLLPRPVEKVANNSNENYIAGDDEVENTMGTEPAEPIVANFFEILIPAIDTDEEGISVFRKSCLAGYCKRADSVELVHYLNLLPVRNLLPRDLLFIFSVSDNSSFEDYYEVVALKMGRDNSAVMTGENIVAAKVVKNSGMNEVQIEFNSKGANDFKRLSGENIDKSLAMVLDGKLIAYPRVMSAISGGKVSISGHFDEKETDVMALILGSGALPLKLTIIKN